MPDHLPSPAIQEALFAGDKIQAIKLYREQTGLGLAESKEAIERLEIELRSLSPDRFRTVPPSTFNAGTSTPKPDHTIGIQEALFAGNKIQAIKLCREQSGLGLKEAKDAVDRLEAELRTLSPDRFQKAQGKGCFVMLVGLVTTGVGIGWLIHRSM